MWNRLSRTGSLVAVLLLVTGCVTVNVYFPAAKVERAAEEIVREVYGQEDQKPDKKKDSSSLMNRILAWMGPSEAHAADAITVSNAAIRGLKNKIAQHHQQLLPFYNGNKVGIRPDGLLAIRTTQGLSVPQAAALKRLVAADNAARNRLYAEVAAALNLSPNQVSQVARIFARHWRGRAQPGWLIN